MSKDILQCITGEYQDEIVFSRLEEIAKEVAGECKIVVDRLDYGRPSEEELIYLLKSPDNSIPAIVTNTRTLGNNMVYSFFRNTSYTKSSIDFFAEIKNEIDNKYLIFPDEWRLDKATLEYGRECVKMLRVEDNILAATIESNTNIFYFKNLNNLSEIHRNRK